MIKRDPDLKNDFIDYMEDAFPDSAWNSVYVHWHPMVSEYCVYIEDKWSGYVPEEYIFKAGFENYKRWKESWSEMDIISLENRFIHDIIRSMVKLCESTGKNGDYIAYVKYYIELITRSKISQDSKDIMNNRALSWLPANGFDEGYVLLKRFVDNETSTEI